MKMLWRDMKRAVCSVGMLLAVIVGLLLLIEPVLDVWRYRLGGGEARTDVLTYFFSALALGGYLIFTPLLTVLPGVLTFCDEWNTGYVKYILARQRPAHYIVHRLIANAVAGGLATALPPIVFAVSGLFVCEPYTMTDLTAGRLSPFHETILEPMELTLGGWGCIATICGLAFLFGVVWSTLALGLSACFPNRYVALCAPFILFFALHLAVNACGLWQYSPTNTILPDVLPSFWFVAVYQAVLLTAGVLLCAVAMSRRLRHV